MALTTLSNVQLAELQADLEQVWAQPQKDKNYQPHADALITTLEKQTAQLTPLESSEKQYDFKVKWIDHTPGTPTTITQNDDCTNTAGSEGVGKSQAFALNYNKSLTFSVEADQAETMFLGTDKAIAVGLAATTKALLEDFNNAIPAALETNRGQVAANYITGTTGWTADTVNKKLTIATANFAVDDIIPQLMRIKRLARNSGGYIMDGGILYNQYYKALKTYVNSDGKTIAEMFKDIDYRHDLDSFAANALTDVFYLVDPGTVAIANRSKYPDFQVAKWTNGASGSYLRYSIPLNMSSLPKMDFVNQGQLTKQSLRLDVQYSIVCSGGKELMTWKLILRAGVFVNPVRLLTTNTGIIKLQKV